MSLFKDRSWDLAGERGVGKGQGVALMEVCADILCNPCWFLPYCIEMHFILLGAFQSNWILSCSKSVMNTWNVNSEVSSYRASLTLGLTWGGGLRYESDFILGLITESLCGVSPCISQVFILWNRVTWQFTQSKIARVQILFLSFTKSDFGQVTEPLCSPVKQR